MFNKPRRKEVSMAEQMLMKHHLIEFISKTELLWLLTGINTFDYSLNEGLNYISLTGPGITMFFMAKADSCKDEWNESNCADHLLIHSIIGGEACSKFELALHCMKLTAEELSSVLEGHINSVHLQLQTRQNERLDDSHNQRSALGSDLAMLRCLGTA